MKALGSKTIQSYNLIIVFQNYTISIMTIKKKWTQKIFGLTIQRSKILKPNHKEKVIHTGWNIDQREWLQYPCLLTIVDSDTVMLKRIEENFDIPSSTFTKEQINTALVEPGYDESLHTPFLGTCSPDKKIKIEWEPTLPPQARK